MKPPLTAKAEDWIELIRKWSVTGLITLLCFAGKSQVREVVRDEVMEMRREIHALQLKVAVLETRK